MFVGDTMRSPFALAVLQVLTTALIGFANAAVYGFSQKAVRQKDMEFIQRHCCGRSQSFDANLRAGAPTEERI